MADSNVTEGWSKWQIAVAVGAPIALGLAGLWYYNRSKSNSKTKKPGERKTDSKSNKTAGVTASGATGKADSTRSAEEGSAAAENAPEVEKSPFEKAQDAKNKGNKYFKGGKYENAIKCYTEAISLCPEDKKQELSTFHQNRAAAYEQLKKYDDVLEDCTKALEYNNRYTKALFRRAKASEISGNLMQSLEDITATCLLEGFQNQQSIMMADRVLKDLGRAHAQEAFQNKQPVDPSPQFIRNYFLAFSHDPIMNNLEKTEEKKEVKEGEEEVEEIVVDAEPEIEKQNQESPEKGHEEITGPYAEAIECLRKKQYRKIISLSSEAIKDEASPQRALALLLRGTFYTLRGEANKAVEDFDKLLDMKDVDKTIRSNALIKRGSLKMQMGGQVAALDDFATAVREDPDNSDVYHHRGQLNLLIDRYPDAIKDLEQAVKLSPDFAIGHAQKCYTEYRFGMMQQNQIMVNTANQKFEEIIKKFPESSEGHALYGQALAEQQEFERAEECFKQAQKLEPDSANILVQRGLLAITWKKDIDSAAQLINKAIECDAKCEYAHETMGTIEVNRGNLNKAIEHFDKAIALAKTEAEMSHLFSLKDGAVAQLRVVERLGIQIPSLSAMF